MTPSWTSPATIVGLAAALAFSLLCYRDMRRALVVVTGVGALQRVQIGSFSGQQMVQGLLPIEVLATALIGVWVLKHRILGNKPLVRCSFDRPLFLLVPASFLSLVVGFTWFDPLIPLDHMKVSVAFGQIVILLWACGLFLVVANSADRITIRRICRLILWLASPSILLTIVPASARPFLDWSMVFALPAASLAASEFFDTQSVLRRLGLVLLIVAPLAFGLATDKAFFYVYVVVSTLVIVALRARSVLVPLVLLSAAMYLLIAAAVTDSLVPSFVTGLIRTETAQQSLGGRGGREQLIMDGLGIWSRYPIAGVGPGNNYPYMLRYSSLGTSHNQYVNLLMELGLIGFACFAVFAVRAAHSGWRLWREARDPFHRQLALAWLGSFAAMLAGGFFGDFMLPSIRNGGIELFGLYYVQWILLGLTVAATALERRSPGVSQ